MASTRKTAKPVTAEVSAMVKAFPAHFAKLEKEYQEITRRMEELKRAGLIYATTYWRKKWRADGVEVKFLYLHYPGKGGQERQRVYVGSDQDKIDAAEAGIARAQEYDKLARESKAISERVNGVQEALYSAQMHLENKVWRSGNWRWAA